MYPTACVYRQHTEMQRRLDALDSYTKNDLLKHLGEIKKSLKTYGKGNAD